MADQGSEGLISPLLRNRRLHVAKPHLNGRVLDVGCGSGTLAREVSPDHYLGVDIDPVSLHLAREAYPQHDFVNQLPEVAEKFDTIVSLAVIEHVVDPAKFLDDLAKHLNFSAAAKILVTTPHPSMDWVHELGSKVGLFSSHANEEHEHLLDRTDLLRAGQKAGLRMTHYRRFMFGANQLALYMRMKS
ncbi:class I SAM-dependent methyltransferase [bacterium]|nr:class I SAM-dependent methyltransferase [bacterium]